MWFQRIVPKRGRAGDVLSIERGEDPLNETAPAFADGTISWPSRRTSARTPGSTAVPAGQSHDTRQNPIRNVSKLSSPRYDCSTAITNQFARGRWKAPRIHSASAIVLVGDVMAALVAGLGLKERRAVARDGAVAAANAVPQPVAGSDSPTRFNSPSTAEPGCPTARRSDRQPLEKKSTRSVPTAATSRDGPGREEEGPNQAGDPRQPRAATRVEHRSRSPRGRATVKRKTFRRRCLLPRIQRNLDRRAGSRPRCNGYHGAPGG